jgi:hypothetical protein
VTQEHEHDYRDIPPDPYVTGLENGLTVCCLCGDLKPECMGCDPAATPSMDSRHYWLVDGEYVHMKDA